MKKEQSNNENINKELEELSPLLAKFRTENDPNSTMGFDVPEDYFARFEKNMLAKIKAEQEVEEWSAQKEEVKAPTFWQRLMKPFATYQVSMALGMVLILVVAGIVGQVAVTNMYKQANLALSETEANNYIEDNIELFSQSFLLDELGEDLAEADLLPSLELEDEAALEEYLEETFIDEIDATLLEEAYN